MATKPDVTLARWADLSTNVDPPSSGQRDTGWTPSQVGVSDYDNIVKRELYLWAKYLDDGILTGKFGVAGTLTPAAFSGTQNDYNPTNLATASFLRLDPSAAATITGIAGGVDGRLLWLVNISANLITLPADDTGSTAANRLETPSFESWSMANRGVVLLRYDGTSSRWRLIYGSGRRVTYQFPALAALAASGPPGYDYTNGYLTNGAGTGVGWIPLDALPVGADLRTAVLEADDVGGSATVEIIRSRRGAVTSVAGPSPSSGAWGTGSAVLTMNHRVDTEYFYFARVTLGAGGSEAAGVDIGVDVI